MIPGSATQSIGAQKRRYNQWVADETLEDYALRFTATRARRSAFGVANTAIGGVSFLACEAIGGSITLAYGFSNAVAAIVAAGILMFLCGAPIAYYAVRYGVDIDLLTRGAGFGYLGSTLTSLIYASFTFILFAIEASIMSFALNMAFRIPLPIAHLISALIVIPIAAYGIRRISRMQLATQPIWLILQFVPLLYFALSQSDKLQEWSAFSGESGSPDGSISPLLFAGAVATLLSLLPQIGEQVDYLRFLPARKEIGALRWWSAMLGAGPGWVVIGAFKLLAGSFLAYAALAHGVPAERAAEPAELYRLVFVEVFHSPAAALIAMGVFVAVCQTKINVTNAYAGSIAWSNFFARITHSHPGRVVWLVFNVLLALLLMELGVFRAIHSILGIYANFAVGWIGALTADLVVNKPLGLSPPHVEFKRAHLYDVNPVGVGAMALSIFISTLVFLGAFGEELRPVSAIIGLVVAFAAAPLIAVATRGRYAIARTDADLPAHRGAFLCSICENDFERADMAFCPAYGAPICSLCCTLEARCHDMCKPGKRLEDQISAAINVVLPRRIAAFFRTRLGRFLGVLVVFALVVAYLLAQIYVAYGSLAPTARPIVGTTLWIVFWALIILLGLASWFLVLAHDSRRAAEKEAERQALTLTQEIEAHKATQHAMQKAKESAEAANLAKSRYIVGLSHEIRTPLNSIFGYAQLMEGAPIESNADGVRIIRRNAEHLASLLDGLLDISRIETGVTRLSWEKVRLPEFLDQIVEMFRPQAEAQGLTFIYERPETLPSVVNTDPKRLRQILINLLSNAIKYTPSGHAALKIRYRGQVAEIEVSDTGLGIRADDLETIFEPFERGRMPQARALPGTGLGLTIVRLLTQVMGAEITVQSAPDAGSKFLLRILLSEVAQPDERSPRAAQIRGYAGPRLKILIADDDGGHIDFLTRILRPFGFNLSAAKDGAAALELAASARPDVAILDISMPALDGWNAAEALRRAFPDMMIVIISADVHDMRSARRAEGAHDAFLTKPLEVQQLLDLLQRKFALEWICDAEKSSAPPSAPPAPPAGLAPRREELLQLGRIGYVRGIETKLSEWETEEPDAASYIAVLRALVKRFDFNKYMDVLRTEPRDG
ncbi:hybrid sensor histidine kinase/response regulator [Methylocella silvestris]|uniref:histidine kinase n=1 Tax=Methylocella silvestris TaxID=199596 RepID=A0A2J7TDU4_METSI|nr:ATP-binding protein [Methylocella silvestris]PNG24913.1 hybrid sensor histidine kinase/response regulator [Methylocella silvestris]